MSFESPDQVIRRWAVERHRYPGWIVLPWKNRKNLFGFDDDLKSVVEHIARQNVANRIPLLEQVAWRCEAMLRLPSWFEELNLEQILLETIEHIVGSFEKVPLRDQPTALLLTVSQLRQLRFSGAKDEYTKLLTFLEAKLSQSPDHELANMVWYQKGIHAAMYFDQDHLNRVLNTWPTQGDIYWQVRKSGLLLEASRTNDALDVLDKVIIAIRSRQDNQHTSVFLQSREAYALFVQRIVFRKVKWEEDFSSTDDSKIDWDRYTAIRSNPLDEIAFFKSRLAVEPIWKDGTTKYRGFDPGRVQTNYSSKGDRVEEDVDAREWLTFCEFVGLAPKLIQNDEVLNERAFNRTAYSSPRGGFHTMLRCGITREVGDRGLMRCRVASMSQEEVTAIRNWLVIALQNSLINLQRQFGVKRPRTESVANMQSLMIALSLLYCRMTSDELGEEVVRLQQMYFSELVRLSGLIHNEYRTQWERLIAALPVEILKNKVAEWLAYPVPGEQGFDVARIFQPGWPDPASIALDKQQSELRKYGSEILAGSNEAVNKLLSTLANSENSRPRLYACSRIGLLHLLHPLSEDAQRRFSAALWSKLDANGLPTESGFLPSFFLLLPSPEDESVDSILRKLIEIEVPDPPLPGRFAIDYFELARQLSMSDIYEESSGIAWTVSELRSFMQKIGDWWSDFSAGGFVDESSFLGRTNRERFDIISDFVLASAITLRNCEEDDKVGFAETFERMLTWRSHPFLLLTLAIMRPSESAQYEKRIADILMCDDEELIGFAVNTLYRWNRINKLSRFSSILQPLSAETVNEVAVLARIHRQPKLRGILELFGDLVSTRPNDRDLQAAGLRTLASFAGKATYRIEPWTRAGRIDPAEVPAIRVGIASLARQLELHGVDDEVVAQWRHATLNDPLPEVRQAASED